VFGQSLRRPGDLLWLCGLIPHPALARVREQQGMAKNSKVIAVSLHLLMVFWGMAMANTSVGASLEAFLLLQLLLQNRRMYYPA
jgi:hypothetical protein